MILNVCIVNHTGVLAEAPAGVHPSFQAAGGASGAAGREEAAGILGRKAGSLRPARRRGVATEACRYWINSVTPWMFSVVYHIWSTLKMSVMTFIYFPLQAQRRSGEPFPGRRWSRGPNSKLPPFLCSPNHSRIHFPPEFTVAQQSTVTVESGRGITFSSVLWRQINFIFTI